jgi:hypothetical protein
VGLTTIRRAELTDSETSMTAANDLAVRRADRFGVDEPPLRIEAHCVDALTRVDGCPRASYLDDHWTETDALRWEPR